MIMKINIKMINNEKNEDETKINQIIKSFENIIS